MTVMISLGSIEDDLILKYKLSRKIKNRKKWRRFSTCERCNSMLMAYISRGHTFEEIMETLHKNHPEIKNIRKYAQYAIRSATGLGIWDDYIYEHNIWQLRNPVLMKDAARDPVEQRATLEGIWRKRTEDGERFIKLQKQAHESIERQDETAEVLEYAMQFMRFREASA